MDRNIRIARQLIAVAKELVGMARFTDGLGEDTGTEEEGNTNRANDREYENILKEMYDPMNANLIIHMGRGADAHADYKGTLGNGNLYMKYETMGKRFIIMGLVSKKRGFTETDKDDIYQLFKFLEKQVNDGYVISTDCNRFSIVFLTGFYKLHKSEYQISYGREHDFNSLAEMHGSNNLSKSISVWKKHSSSEPDSNIDNIYDIDENLENRFNKHPRTNDQVKKIQQRRENELINIVKERENRK